ncbi:hypothetical protein PLICRDRAFT_50474 [Plicaturopsis crispa FD-325 SS-3]|nr:hypothetical protein PLICRDRAFT_50474 [Plicaturopsis crispa FD-325 SS-3]
MIVIPCARCTSSITATNRATNGHRFVFHSNEIVSCERRYVPGEPGVIPFIPLPPPIEPSYAYSPPPPMHPMSRTASSPGPPPLEPIFHATHTRYQQHRAQFPEELYQQRSPSPPALVEQHPRDQLHFNYPRLLPRTPSESPPPLAETEYLPTPPLESPPPASPETDEDAYPFPSSTRAPPPPSSRPPQLPPAPPSRPEAYISDSSLHSQSYPRAPPSFLTSRTYTNPHADPAPRGMPVEKEAVRRIPAGAVIFWHNLARNGEIPGVADTRKRMTGPAFGR